MEKIPASVFILTKNSADTIRRALDSVSDFEDIVVCDGGSTDDTVRIARSASASVFLQPAQCLDGTGRIKDFSCARNFCLDRTKYDLVLYIDSDEYLSADAAEEIRSLAAHPNPAAWVWRMPRIGVLNGKIIECSLSYPNRQVRFFHKRHTVRFIKSVHERIDVSVGEKIGVLRSGLFFQVPRSVTEARAKSRRYLSLEDAHLGAVPRSVIARNIIHTIRAQAGSIVRLKGRFFCRGRKAPLRYEWLRFEYNFQLLGLLLRHLL